MAAVDYTRQTVLVTGASAGIGAEFARQLAARGADLVLVARRRDRLDALAGELRAAHDIQATPIVADLAAPGAAGALATAIAERGITVTSLVNNAAFGTNAPFHLADGDRLHAEITVNVASLVDLTHTFIDQLRATGTGVLINMASVAAYQATPTLAVYGATKAFVLHFTEALWYESRGTGLRVLALSPGATETEFFDVAGGSADGGMRRMSPRSVVATALTTLDRRNPPPSVVVGRMNRIMARASRLTTRRRTTMTIGAIMDRSTAHA